MTGFTERFPHEFVFECQIDLSPSEDHRYINFLAFKREGFTWSDGVIINFETSKSPDAIAGRMKDALDQFESWAIWNDNCEYSEKLSGGLLTRFFERREGRSISSIYVMAREGDAHFESSIEDLRSQLNGPNLPIFHFRDGQVLLRWTDEPSKITVRRAQQRLNRFDHWAIIDSEGITESSGGVMWYRQLPLDFLYFGDVEGFEDP